MPNCPSIERCPFFLDKMANRPAMANMMKHRYCETDNSECARWQVAKAKGGPSVPLDLYPNELARVPALIA